METFTAAGKLPQVLLNTVDKPSTGIRSAFQTAYDYTGSVWEWIEETIVRPDGTVGPRPELDIWLTGMWKFGLEHVQAPAVCTRYEDFPWEAVGSKTVVDVGAGVGMLAKACVNSSLISCRRNELRAGDKVPQAAVCCAGSPRHTGEGERILDFVST